MVALKGRPSVPRLRLRHGAYELVSRARLFRAVKYSWSDLARGGAHQYRLPGDSTNRKGT